MGTKIRQVTGMRRQRSDEETLERALGVQSVLKAMETRTALHESTGEGTERRLPLQTIQLHTPVDKRLCGEAKVAISTSYVKPQNHSH